MGNGISGDGKGRVFVTARSARWSSAPTAASTTSCMPPIGLAIPVDNVECDASTNTLHMGSIPQSAL